MANLNYLELIIQEIDKLKQKINYTEIPNLFYVRTVYKYKILIYIIA